MKISNHRLQFDDGRPVDFAATPNKSGKLVGGKPKFVVIHYTAAGSASGSVRHLQKTSSKASAHLVVGRDGSITQMGDFNEKLWHAGKSRWAGIKGLNGHSVGIEIANWGPLSGGAGNWKSWAGARIPDSRAMTARHRNGGPVQGWETYDPEQIEACADIVRALLAEYGLGASAVIGHDDISPGRKSDPGPAFSMKNFRSLVAGRDDDDDDDDDETYRVDSNTGLNMRTGPGLGNGKIKLLANGTKVVKLDEEDGRWWEVAELVNGDMDTTGWVHSRWLDRV